MSHIDLIIACVASVSVWFRSKKRPRNRIFGFGRVNNGTNRVSESSFLKVEYKLACMPHQAKERRTK